MVSLTMPQSATVDIGATLLVTITLPASPPPPVLPTHSPPIVLAWVIPPDDFHPEEVRGKPRARGGVHAAADADDPIG